MKIHTHLIQTIFTTTFLLLTLLPLIAMAHGGATPAEEAPDSNLKLIVSVVVLLTLGAFIWFTIFRKK